MIYLTQSSASVSLKMTEELDQMVLIHTITKERVDLDLVPLFQKGGYYEYQVTTKDLEQGEWEYTGYLSGSREARGILVIEGPDTVQYRGTYTDLNVIQYDGRS